MPDPSTCKDPAVRRAIAETIAHTAEIPADDIDEASGIGAWHASSGEMCTAERGANVCTLLLDHDDDHRDANSGAAWPAQRRVTADLLRRLAAGAPLTQRERNTVLREAADEIDRLAARASLRRIEAQLKDEIAIANAACATIDRALLRVDVARNDPNWRGLSIWVRDQLSRLAVVLGDRSTSAVDGQDGEAS